MNGAEFTNVPVTTLSGLATLTQRKYRLIAYSSTVQYSVRYHISKSSALHNLLNTSAV